MNDLDFCSTEVCAWLRDKTMLYKMYEAATTTTTCAIHSFMCTFVRYILLTLNQK